MTKKILIVSTHPSLTTGYARIANVVGNYLAGLSDVFEVWHFGFEKYPGTYLSDRFVDPRIKIISVVDRIDPAMDRFGTTIIKDVVYKEVKPDLMLVYNDVVVTSQMLNSFMDPSRPFKIVSYLDLVYKWECVEFVEHIDRWSDRIFVFSECWREHLVGDFGIDASKVYTFPHGFDSGMFKPVDRAEARRALALQPDDYIVLNTNRNSYRKALDVTIGGFLRFWKSVRCPPRVKLFLNCRVDVSDGYDIPNLIRVECMKLGLDAAQVSNRHILTMGGNASGLLSDETLNVVYNASDVGLNTCVGEGFGLCNLEGAGLGIPQIVSDVGGLHDIFSGLEASLGCTVISPAATMYLARGIDSHGGEISIVRPEDVAAALRRTYDAAEAESRGGSNRALRAHIIEKYHWPTLLASFVGNLFSDRTPS